MLVAVVVHLSVSWQDFATLAKNGYLYDDSFYAFKIARNIADGRGPTFDGVTYTNGFQPLYVFALVPIFWITGPDPALPIYVGLTLLALLTVATAYLLLLILKRHVSDRIALFAAMIWLFSPVVIRQSTNGLETALALFLFAFCVYYYLDRIRSNPNPSRGTFVKMGVLLGLTVLARVDEIFLAFAIALDYLLLLRKRRVSSRRALGDVGLAALSAFAVYLPWIVYGFYAVGNPFQESGVATRFLSLAYAPFFHMGSGELAKDGPGVSFVLAHVEHSLCVLKLSPPVHAFFRAVEKVGESTGLNGVLVVGANVVGITAMAASVFWVRRRRKISAGGNRKELDFLLLFAVLLIAAYSLYMFGMFFFTRYYYPVYFVLVLYAACFLQDILGWASGKRPLYRRVTIGVFSVYALGLLYMGFGAGFRSAPLYHFYDVAKWVEANTEKNDTIGVFQGGAIGYLSNRRVVNLDGKVNKFALHALKDGNLVDYVRDAGIDVVMDHKTVLRMFFGAAADGGLRLAASRECFRGTKVGANGWIGYRLSRSSGLEAGATVSSPGGPSGGP